MARIAGIDLPKNKRGEIALTYISGIGRSTELLRAGGAEHTLVDMGEFRAIGGRSAHGPSPLNLARGGHGGKR